MFFSSEVHSLYKLLKKSNIHVFNRHNINFENHEKQNTHIPRPFNSLLGYLSPRTVATIAAPCIGGLEYMGLMTSFSWLSARKDTASLLHTWQSKMGEH